MKIDNKGQVRTVFGLAQVEEVRAVHSGGAAIKVRIVTPSAPDGPYQHGQTTWITVR